MKQKDENTENLRGNDEIGRNLNNLVLCSKLLKTRTILKFDIYVLTIKRTVKLSHIFVK